MSNSNVNHHRTPSNRISIPTVGRIHETRLPRPDDTMRLVDVTAHNEAWCDPPDVAQKGLASRATVDHVLARPVGHYHVGMAS